MIGSSFIFRARGRLDDPIPGIEPEINLETGNESVPISARAFGTLQERYGLRSMNGGVRQSCANGQDLTNGQNRVGRLFAAANLIYPVSNMRWGGRRNMANRFDGIGNHLRAYRMGRDLSADQIAERLGVSRAAVYRIEAGEVVKIETLERLAAVLETSVSSLLGVGVEYYANAVSYFERMRQIEEEADQVIAYFPPISYLLSSKEYPGYLRQTLVEAMPPYIEDVKKYKSEIDKIIAILNERRGVRRQRHLSVVNFVNLPEIERWLKLGLVGGFDLSPKEVARRRLAVRVEVEHLIALIEREPMGVQIGLIEETLPNLTFQLFRTSDRTLLGLSPFRLGGELPNVHTGIAMLTADEEPVKLYEQLAERLWSRAHKGRDAVTRLRAIIERSGVVPLSVRKAS